MTLRELFSTSHGITRIYADVRDNGKLIKSYHIGQYEQEDQYPDLAVNGTEARWTCIRKPLDSKESGTMYFQPLVNNIPKELLDMTVHSWQLWQYRTENNGLTKFYWLNVWLEGKDECVATIEKEKTPKQEQIEGQTDIFNYLEEVED